MPSKELNEILNETRRTKDISLSVEQVEELINDLEILEEYKKILGTPIQAIMKDLKVLEILKKHLSFKKEWNNVFFEIDDCDVLLPFNDIEKEAIKEWLYERND